MRYFLPILVMILCIGCTRYADGRVEWHPSPFTKHEYQPGEPLTAPSAAAHNLLNEHGAMYRGTPNGNPWRATVAGEQQDDPILTAHARWERRQALLIQSP